MSFAQQRVKLRLCEQLRIHAPQLFNRNSGGLVEPPMATAGNVGQVKSQEGHNYPQSLEPIGLVWKGKIARNGKKVVETLAFNILGNCNDILNEKMETINITHRLKWDEASKNTPQAVFYLEAATPALADPFKEYIDYFKTKDRIGVAAIGKEYTLYICASGNPLYDKYAAQLVEGNRLIVICVGSALLASASSSTGNAAKAQGSQEQVGDWLNQLSTITAMLGSKK